MHHGFKKKNAGKQISSSFSDS